MELDLGTAIVGGIAIVISVLPFILMNRSRKKREKQYKELLSKLAAQNNCQIDQHEISGNFGIGLDETKNFVFFFRKVKDKVDEQSVDLGEIQTCKVINSGRTFKTRDGNQKVIDRLELCLTPVAKSKPGIKLEFFNADVNTQLYGELQSADKWSKLINIRLKNRKKQYTQQQLTAVH